MSRLVGRPVAVSLVLAAVGVGLAACGDDGNSGAPTSNEALDCANAPAVEGDPAEIRIGYGKAAEEPVWLMDSMPSVAPQLGESYELEMRPYDDSEKKVVGYQAGEVDAFIAPAPSLIVGTARGALDTVALFTVMQEASPDGFGTTFVVQPDSGIESVEDLEGKVVGINDFRSTPDFLIRLALKDAGVDTGDVEFVPAPFPAQIEALNSGVVDAAVLVEPFFTMAMNSENPPEVLFTSQDATGYAYDQLIMAVDREFAAKNLGAVCAFRDDYADALLAYQADKDEAKRSIQEAGFVGELPLEIYEQAADYGQPEGGRFDPASLEPLMDDMTSVGLLEEDQRVDVEKLYVPGFTAGTVEK